MLGCKFSNELNINIRSVNEILRDDSINNQVKHKILYKNILQEIKIYFSYNEQQTTDSKHFFKFKK
jgi:uncharacterized SAM-dependent methyltransferase